MPPARHFPARASRGFTLIELLTVIAIIGILAVIILLSIGRMRESAQRSACIANLRQIQAANLLHAADNKGYYVRIKKNDVWWNVQEDFFRYLNADRQTAQEDHGFVEPMKCPTAVAGLLTNSTNNWEKQNFPGYGYMPNGAEDDGTKTGTFTQINQNNINPAKAIAFCDALDFWCYGAPNSSYKWDQEYKTSTRWSRRHRNARNVVYFDGHTATLPAP